MVSANVAGFVAVVLYIVACGFLARGIKNREKLPTTVVLALGVLALPLHLISVHAQIYQPEGLNLGLLDLVSLVGWLIATLSILVNLYRPVIGITLIAYPLAALSLLLSQVIVTPYKLQTTLPAGAEAHILLSILAYAVLMIAAIHACLLAIQDQQLRQRKRNFLPALPPLQTMESMLFEIIAVGFALLSLAIISGFVTLNDVFAQHVAHKTVLTLLAWFIFAVLLAGRHFLGWRGQTAIRITLAGFVVLLLGFYGSKLVLEFIIPTAIK